ncbi:hypothetical protein EXS57_02820 [Candidatus Kaiserbacteria bacterium]|nr:hypothetical protein [Candidatus Kaiserbacteria bacterium]
MILVILLAIAGLAFASPLLRSLVVQKIVEVKDTVVPSPSLNVTPTSGSLPLTVKIIYPEEWQLLINEECSHTTPVPRLGGTAFTIDWGDGRNGTPCDTHTYTATGTFTIKAQIYAFDDIPHGDWGGFSKMLWEAAATITVSGAATAPSVELLSPQDGESYKYQEFPDVKWRITTGKKVALRIELLDQDGNTFASETKNGIAYDGEGSLRVFPRSWEVYDALLRAGKTKFSVQVSLVDNGQVVAQKRSADLIMSAQFTDNVNGGLQISPTSGPAPLKVSFNYTVWNPVCFSYKVDWGDGTTPDSMIQQAEEGKCILKGENKVFTHTYTKVGTYKIMMKTNNLDTFKDLDSIVMYESVTVHVQ